MTIFTFKETFKKYITPFLGLTKAMIANASGVVDSIDATRPSSVDAGEYWDKDTGERFYFDGTNDIPAGKTRPSGLSDGDEWVDTSTVPATKKIVAGSTDEAVLDLPMNVAESNTDSITDAEALAIYNNIG